MAEQKMSVASEVNGATSIEYPVVEGARIVIVINNQYTNAPNTTQIASGAGRSSAAGSNAAIDSSNTQQQQSVGGDGKAENEGMKGKQIQPATKHKCDDADIVLVLNNQINESGAEAQSSSTQVASGAGTYSAAGTNAALESANTKQQHAVAGGKKAVGKNKGMNSEQIEFKKSRKRPLTENLAISKPKLYLE
ncbi:hypothetical protein [Sutcliffiella halmapala]|uniref:hypothetical protein n=1 Tax=Sutcliffiella halmapala TaxID=79882 RepID=UPI0009957862|nr:hypothetical protein [Sutcliffiella halmapala]